MKNIITFFCAFLENHYFGSMYYGSESHLGAQDAFSQLNQATTGPHLFIYFISFLFISIFNLFISLLYLFNYFLPKPLSGLCNVGC